MAILLEKTETVETSDLTRLFDGDNDYPEKVTLLEKQSRYAAIVSNGEHGLCIFRDEKSALESWGKVHDTNGWKPVEFEFFEACQIARNRPPIKYLFLFEDDIKSVNKKYPVD